MMNKENLKLIDDCMKMQHQFNVVVNPDWKKANYAWRRAMWIESAELLDHIGYKWWKNVDAEPDAKQVLLEVVDIFHFMLSECLLDNKTSTDLAYAYEWALRHTSTPTKEKVMQQVEEFVMACIDHRTSIYTTFFQVVVALKIDLTEILKYYIGKNALNKFRQDNGYKAGTYRKMWTVSGIQLEDNQVLEGIIETISAESINYDLVYNMLSDVYKDFV